VGAADGAYCSETQHCSGGRGRTAQRVIRAPWRRMEKRLRRYCAAAFRVHRVRLCVERRRASGYPRPRVRDVAHAACGSCGVRGLAMCKACGLVPGRHAGNRGKQLKRRQPCVGQQWSLIDCEASGPDAWIRSMRMVNRCAVRGWHGDWHLVCSPPCAQEPTARGL